MFEETTIRLGGPGSTPVRLKSSVQQSSLSNSFNNARLNMILVSSAPGESNSLARSSVTSPWRWTSNCNRSPVFESCTDSAKRSASTGAASVTEAEVVSGGDSLACAESNGAACFGFSDSACGVVTFGPSDSACGVVTFGPGPPAAPGTGRAYVSCTFASSLVRAVLAFSMPSATSRASSTSVSSSAMRASNLERSAATANSISRRFSAI
mmetsp:Transcript_74827/g.148251  ORF Transcript_74827/g.148251 Transcript_74827/m.148251 type:complete len:210 (-) Transcript_74827:1150-1779(-)